MQVDTGALDVKGGVPATKRFMAAYFVGTSGFASPVLRPSLDAANGSSPEMLESYARLFDAVEMDSVFLRPPSRATVETWNEATSDKFSFSVRMPKQTTHVDRLAVPLRVSGFVDTLSPIAERLGCLLFSIPPSMNCDHDRMRRTLEAVPPGLRTAWEVRNSSWTEPSVLDMMRDFGATPVVVDNLDGVHCEAHMHSMPFVYCRFRRESYRVADLMDWGRRLGAVLASGRDVFAFFRVSEHATSYVLALQELLCEAAGGLASSSTFARSQDEDSPSFPTGYAQGSKWPVHEGNRT